MKKLFPVLLLLVVITRLSAQHPPIFVDGFFTDWQSIATAHTDPQNDAGAAIDVVDLSIFNDQDYVYFRINLAQEVILQESEFRLFIDADNDVNTETNVHGMGAEFSYRFGNRNGNFLGRYVTQSQVGIVSLPTHSATAFEIAISRHKMPDNSHRIFRADTIRVVVETGNGQGDYLPDVGNVAYVLNQQNPEPLVPVMLEKEDTALLRISNWNVLGDGPFENHRTAGFNQILKSVQADIWAFQEFFNSTAEEVKTYLDNILPTGTSEGWHTVKLDRDNVTASRYPILENWLVLQGHNITASLIDLPENHQTDILVVNCHFRCCTANLQRQQEADALVSFLKDALTEGGRINLQENTPIIILGDLNLVGNRQQLLTLLHGDIVDTVTYGGDMLPDWDNSPLEDLVSYHNDSRLAYTWYDEFSDFMPGRLDYMIYTGSVMKVKKAFTLETSSMSATRLANYHLNATDSRVSDHLPKVADFQLQKQEIIGINEQEIKVNIYPNPVSGMLSIDLSQHINQADVSIRNMNGATLLTQTIRGANTLIDFSAFHPGIYVVHIQIDHHTIIRKLIKLP